MRLKRCDRCGKETRDDEIHVELPSIKSERYIFKFQYQGPTRYEYQIDLCEDCARGVEHIFEQCRNQYALFIHCHNWKEKEFAKRWSGLAIQDHEKSK